MTYEERTRMIFEFLWAQKDGLLRRYQAPDYLTDDRRRDEITDMVEDINGEIPSNIGEASMGILFGKIRKALRRRHGGRSWPAIKVLLACVSDGLQEIEDVNGDAGDVEGQMVSRLADWYKRHGNCMPSSGSEMRTAALVDRGVLTAREARYAGFPMTKELGDLAKSQPRCAQEVSREARVYAKIWRCTEAEAVDRLIECGQVSEHDDVPEILRRVMV